MRILFLALDVNLTHQRGDSVHALEMASAFARLGHRVALVVGASGPVTPRSEALDVHVLRGSDLRVLASLRKIQRRFRADVVYERRTTPKIGVALGLGWDLPVVMELNGILEDELAFQGRSPARSIGRSIRSRLRRTMFAHIDRFVVVANAIRQDLEARYGVEASRIHVVGNGVDADRFRPIDKQTASQDLGLEPGRPRVVFVGNLVPWRDFNTVLAAIRIVRRVLPNVELLIVGSGQEGNRLRLAVKEMDLEGSVRFAGEVPHDDVPRYICSADVGLVPEKVRPIDISPLKLYEYLACGRPVLGFDVPGLETVRSLGFGILVAPKEPERFAAALASLLNDPARRQEMGERSRAYVEAERSWLAVAARVVEIVRGAARRAS